MRTKEETTRKTSKNNRCGKGKNSKKRPTNEKANKMKLNESNKDAKKIENLRLLQRLIDKNNTFFLFEFIVVLFTRNSKSFPCII